MHRTSQPLQERAEGTRPGQSLGELVADVPGIEIGEDEDVRLPREPLARRRSGTSAPPPPAPARRPPGARRRTRNRPGDGRGSPPPPRPCRPAGGGRCRGSRTRAARPAAPRRGADGSSPRRPPRCRRALRRRDRAPRRSPSRSSDRPSGKVIRKQEETRPTPGCGPTAASAARRVSAVVASAPMTAAPAAPPATSAQARWSGSASRRSSSAPGKAARPRAGERDGRGPRRGRPADSPPARPARRGRAGAHSAAALRMRGSPASGRTMRTPRPRTRLAQPGERIAHRSRPVTTELPAGASGAKR